MASETPNLSKLAASIRKAACPMKGPFDAAAVKTYIFPLRIYNRDFLVDFSTLKFIIALRPKYELRQGYECHIKKFAAELWGRNLYGTPQGSADSAIRHHILQSLRSGGKNSHF